MVPTVPVLPLNSQVLPGHNQETYQRLQEAVQSTPPYQLWFATCDDLPLQRQLAATLEESLIGHEAIAQTQLIFDGSVPDIVQQIRAWTHQAAAHQLPLLQILGLEQLTYRGSDAQYEFLQSLHHLLPLWQQLGCNLLLWMPRPWLRQVRREVPQLLGHPVFEFMGEPTPISAIADQQAYQATFSPVRRWQFMGKPAPEVPTQVGDGQHDARITPESTAVPAVPTDETTDALDNETSEPTLPSVSESLWEQLQADLLELEQGSDAAIQNRNVSLEPAESAAQSYGVTTEETSPTELVETEVLDTENGRSDTTEELADTAALPSPSSDDHDTWTQAYRLRDRIQAGDHRPATLAQAIREYERWHPQRSTTPQRTEILNDLGSLYWLWAQQSDTAELYFQRLQSSRELYEAALSPISGHPDAGVLNRLHSNLGSVYSLLAAHHDPPQYLGKAVRAFHRALQYAPVEVFPAEYTTLQTHLGTAYWSLAQHTQEAAHLHRAIAAYQEALTHAQPQVAPQAYAQLQNNLGIALWSLSRHERPQFLLEQAIGAYRTALAYRTLDTDPAGCAATHNNLGTAYWDLGGHCEERSSAQQQAWRHAINAYETAIVAASHSTEQALGFDLWATHHSVGVVYDQLAIALAPDATAQHPLLTRATPHYIKALVGWQAAEAVTTETAFQALVRNLQLQSRYLDLETQQRSLSQVPADWLPELWRKL